MDCSLVLISSRWYARSSNLPFIHECAARVVKGRFGRRRYGCRSDPTTSRDVASASFSLGLWILSKNKILYTGVWFGVLNIRRLESIDKRRLRRLQEKTLGWRFSIVHIPGSKLRDGPPRGPGRIPITFDGNIYLWPAYCHCIEYRASARLVFWDPQLVVVWVGHGCVCWLLGIVVVISGGTTSSGRGILRASTWLCYVYMLLVQMACMCCHGT